MLRHLTRTLTTRARSSPHALTEPKHSLLPLLTHHANHTPHHVAIAQPNQADCTYAQLAALATQHADRLRPHVPAATGHVPARVGLLCPGDLSFASWWVGALHAGTCVVPLSPLSSDGELDYYLAEADVSAVVVHESLHARVAALPSVEKRHVLVTDTPEPSTVGAWAPGAELYQPPGEHASHVVFTSGTTGRPKAVLTSHTALTAQTGALRQAWEWSADDRSLLVLPLHHVHGLVVNLTTALSAGACCEMLPGFDVEAVWDALARDPQSAEALSVFMAVPTIYSKLIQHYETLDAEAQKHITQRLSPETNSRMRLMVSGSAALPPSVHETWAAVSGGHTLLERYGMSEFGMAISNSLHGKRYPGAVGKPLPGVEARLVDDEQNEVSELDTPGELLIRGPNMFSSYFGRPDATQESFVDGEWFLTGDVAVRRRMDDGEVVYAIEGRRSADIIKSGAYKIGALEIERYLLEYPGVQGCAVLGVPDEVYGERIGALIETSDVGNPAWRVDRVREFLAQHVAKYKLPSVVRVTEAIPRNHMGKINKKELLHMFAKEEEDG